MAARPGVHDLPINRLSRKAPLELSKVKQKVAGYPPPTLFSCWWGYNAAIKQSEFPHYSSEVLQCKPERGND